MKNYFWRPIEPYDIIPTGYGVAYWTPKYRLIWTMPIPLNIIVNYAVRLWLWLKNPEHMRFKKDGKIIELQ